MAETFLSPVIEKLIDLLVEEAKSLKGVHRDVKSLQKELEILEPFLRDAEAKSNRGELNQASKVWLKQLREEAERIEEVVDEYLCHVGHHRHPRGFLGSLRKAGRFIKGLCSNRDIASEIRDIKDSLREIKDRGESYGLRPFEQVGLSRSAITMDPRIGSLFVDDDELVGIDSTSKELVTSLIEGPSTRQVISLVGEGGIGKTTLARKVYNDVLAKGHFDCHVWITVSQSCNIEKILKTMKNQICPAKEPFLGECTMIEETIMLLRKSLQGVRYVVVFDDVWKTDFWDVMKHALPSNKKGCRIIITTRNFTVADSFKETSCDVIQKELYSWSQEQALELFCKRTFGDFEGHCPSELLQLSYDFLSKCQGLPLVIVAVAGLLSKKEKTELDWQRVLNSLNLEFKENSQLTHVSRILSFGYNDLPYHLKPCFLYFGVFPEDFPIWEERLYDIWISEGFIKPKSDKTLEQVAREHLDELVCRNLVSFTTRNLGYQRWFRVHDLIRDIILTKWEEFCFSQVTNETKSRCREEIRRLSIHGTTQDVFEMVRNCKIQSIFVFNINELNKSFVAKLFKTFKLLKVLDFEDSPLDNLPKQIGNLYCLKSLNLRCTNVRKLPKTIGKLQNLERLDVYDTLVRRLPVEINKLTRLRSLQAYCRKDPKNGSYNYMAVRIHKGFGYLEELQKLDGIKAYPGGVGFAKELERLRKLKVLSISDLTTEVGRALGASLEKMNHLEKLCLSFINDDETLDLEGVSLPSALRYLKLSCRLDEFSYLVARLQNLQGLHLAFSSLMHDSLKCLAGLPNLEYLYMHQAYDGEELHFEEGSFPKLKKLYLREMEELKVVRIDQGALPCLEELKFGPLPLMKEMPSDVQRLKSLKLLGLMDMTREFVARLQPNGGLDHWKIRHIPSVTFSYTCKERGYELYYLGSSDLLQRLQEDANS